MVAREKFIKDYHKKREIEKAKLAAQRNKYLAEKEAKKEDAGKIVKRGFTPVYHIIPVDGGRKWHLRKMGDQKIIKTTSSQIELINFYKKNIGDGKAKLYVHDKNGKYHLYK